MNGGKANDSHRDVGEPAGSPSHAASAAEAGDTGESVRMSLGELAAHAGVPRRTIRYYIGRGILPRPASAGRGAYYGAAHLERLERIQVLKQEGYTLGEIGSMLASKGRSVVLPEPDTYWSYRIAPDVLVMVQAGLAPWRHSRIRDALAEMASRLQQASAL